MKFIRLLMTLGLVLFLSTAFVGCGGGSDSGGGGDVPALNDDELNKDDDQQDDETTSEAEEGSEENPKIVSWDSNYTFNISAADNTDSMYLKVTTNEAGYYYFKATTEAQEDSIRAVQIMLYIDQFEGWADATGYFGSLLVDLEANTTYYVELQNTTSDAISCNVHTADIGTLNEGSTSDPVVITMGENYSAKVGVADENTQDSFYRFTTNDKPYYLIATTDDDLEITLYEDSGFSNLIGTAEDGKLGKELDPNAEYFIK